MFPQSYSQALLAVFIPALREQVRGHSNRRLSHLRQSPGEGHPTWLSLQLPLAWEPRTCLSGWSLTDGKHSRMSSVVVQTVHLHQHTHATSTLKSASIVSANMVSVALRLT